MDALGGNIDATMSYKFVNRSSGNDSVRLSRLECRRRIVGCRSQQRTPTLSQQWRISSDLDGYFQIASLNPGAGSTTKVLDDSGASTTNGTAVVQSTVAAEPAGSTEQEWSIVSAGDGYFKLVNRLSGLALDTSGGTGATGRVCSSGTRKQPTPRRNNGRSSQCTNRWACFLPGLLPALRQESIRSRLRADLVR